MLLTLTPVPVVTITEVDLMVIDIPPAIPDVQITTTETIVEEVFVEDTVSCGGEGDAPGQLLPGDVRLGTARPSEPAAPSADALPTPPISIGDTAQMPITMPHAQVHMKRSDEGLLEYALFLFPLLPRVFSNVRIGEGLTFPYPN